MRPDLMAAVLAPRGAGESSRVNVARGSTDSRRSTGAGLGLNLCKGLASLLGGELTGIR